MLGIRRGRITRKYVSKIHQLSFSSTHIVSVRMKQFPLCCVDSSFLPFHLDYERDDFVFLCK